MLVLVAPGQGAQTPGFLEPWLDVPGVADRLTWWSAVTGLDLIYYGTKATAEEIKDTAITQPLLVASGLAAALALFPHPGDAFKVVGAVAGHSVGELTAAAGTGVINAEAALVLTRERGRAMAEASAKVPTGMTAVLGGDPEEVLAKIEQHGLTPANNNGAGQIVAAGTLEQLERFQADPPEKARLRPLQVAGAFHTHHMAPAVDHVARLAKAITTRDPRTRLLSNRDGAVVQDGRQVLNRIVDQIAKPVRWDLCMRTLGELGATAVIEMPPAGVLTGLIKRALPGVETLALKTPDDLDAARALVEKHGTPSPLDDAPSWRLVVAPFSGKFRSAGVALGTTLEPGAVVGAVVSHRDEQQITVPHGGTVIEWLVEDGDPVSPGQPLVRLHPEAS
ncbi:biotin attachment protein [Carbonactinospora thermoautotrophica]|uniref:[acyl-carrier-protein] S-malonyltransferase n=1 Tax=Carbonactinospora thermoautotrophica TaxID=1469144 RepID=A0A132MWY0_9ACTN|nr:biotin attachment protein [Carbonactinospora thermoautotrophica]KWX01862.1 Malonyl CoA-acyl carrier protein transacylase [Carbonactinospora thermoautotrophica]KWX09957.1 biotin attachment protein [Carbonactinospora thermoautotrophica]